ncbi:MAG: hypothetical protein ACJAX3_001507 [Patiriisocius sp.]|jgi:hypothetical protein
MLPNHCLFVNYYLNLYHKFNLNGPIMKNIILVIAVLFSGSMMNAQECSKTCAKKEIKNSYVQDGAIIKATLFHGNGEVAQTGTYTKANKLEGKWISFDAEGNKTAIAYYDAGKKVGTWLFYQGTTLKEVSYDKDAIAAVNTYSITDTRVVSNRP